jgi:hypothetical protein
MVQHLDLKLCLGTPWVKALVVPFSMLGVSCSSPTLSSTSEGLIHFLDER